MTCHAETTAGTRCKNPAQANGYCHIPSHQAQSQPETGRHNKCTPDRIERACRAAMIGTSIKGCARAAGVSQATIFEWLSRADEGPPFSEFSEQFTRARSRGEQSIIAKVHERKPEFLLERSFGYTKELRVDGDMRHEHAVGPSPEIRRLVRALLPDLDDDEQAALIDRALRQAEEGAQE